MGIVLTALRRPYTFVVMAILMLILGVAAIRTTSKDILQAVARGEGPRQLLVTLGYAGWAPGQLENELSRNAWYTAPADPGIVFDDDRNKVWEHAVARRTQDL